MEHLTHLDRLTSPTMDRLMQLGCAEPAALARLTKTVAQQAAILAIDEALWIVSWIFLLLYGLVWLARPTVLPSCEAAARNGAP